MAKQFFEGSDFRKEHIAFGPTWIPFAIEILHPKVIGQELIALGFEIFQGDRMLNLLLERHAGQFRGVEQDDLARFLAGKRIGQSSFADSEIIRERCRQVDFLEGRDSLICWSAQLDCRWFIGEDSRRELLLHFRVASVAVG